MEWTARCGRPPLLLPSCRKLEFRLSALMDLDLAWVNGKSGRQSWRYADTFQRRGPALYNIGSHLPFGAQWHLLPPPCDTSVLSRLRTVTPLPRLSSRTKKLCSFVIYALNNYQESTKLTQNSTLPTQSSSFSYYIECESKKSPLGDLTFFIFFTNGWEFVIDFLHTYQLSPILTKLCHIKRDYPVHIICAKCPKRSRSDVCVSRW